MFPYPRHIAGISLHFLSNYLEMHDPHNICKLTEPKFSSLFLYDMRSPFLIGCWLRASLSAPEDFWHLFSHGLFHLQTSNSLSSPSYALTLPFCLLFCCQLEKVLYFLRVHVSRWTHSDHPHFEVCCAILHKIITRVISHHTGSGD